MAFQNNILTFGHGKSAADLSAAAMQYTLMKGTSDAVVAQQVTLGGVVLGVLQNTPGTSGAASVMAYGITKVRVDSTAHIAIGLMAKLIASTSAAALPTTAASPTVYIVGRALEALSSNSTGIISMLITHQGAGSTGTHSAA